jgi:hypothetical protein
LSEPNGGDGSAAPPQAPVADEPVLPAAVDLQEAVGAPIKRRLDEAEAEPELEPGEQKWSRRTLAVAGGSLIVGIGVVALVFLGRANSDRYLITCSTTQVTPEQGRGFPPWGSRPLAGPGYKPIALPANAECTPHETDSLAELDRLFLDMLVDRASTTLSGSNLLEPGTKGMAAPLDAANDQLAQALLLARAPERRDQRKEVERLLGDVQYWRATARLRDATAALLDASKQFDAAAAARPRHVRDAADWAGFVRKLTDEVHAGPSGTASAPQPTTIPTTIAPPATALPVEGSASLPASNDAGHSSLPTGGVLL